MRAAVFAFLSRSQADLQALQEGDAAIGGVSTLFGVRSSCRIGVAKPAGARLDASVGPYCAERRVVLSP